MQTNRIVLLLLGPLLLFTTAHANESTIGRIQATTQALSDVQQHGFSRLLQWFGKVAPIEAVSLTAHTDGRITTIRIDDGAQVTRGDLLMTLGGRAIKAQFQALQAQLQATDNGLQAATKNLQSLQSMFSRQLATRVQLNAASQALTLAATQHAAARQALDTLSAATQVQAFIDGRFTVRSVNSGQYVRAGTRLARIINPSRLRIEATLFPPNGLNLTGVRAVITPPAGEHQRHATVTHVFPETTPAGGVKVWIEGADLTGMHVGAMVSGVLTGATHLSLAVPASAIARNEQGQAFVFVQAPEGLRKRAVTVGVVDHELVEITAGLHAGEQVLNQGAYEMLYADFDQLYQEPD